MILFATCAIVSCTWFQEPKPVSVQWRESLSQLDITPVFPPREDIRVGDLYLVPNVGINLDINLSLLLEDLQINSRINQFYRNRPSFGKTRISSEDKIIQNEFKSDLLDPTAGLGRARLVAFPGFSLASINSSTLGASGSVSSNPLRLLFGREKISDLTISIPFAESYALPVSQLLEQFESECKDIFKDNRIETYSSFGNEPALLLIYEIYMSRKISYFYNDRKASVTSIEALSKSAEEIKSKLEDASAALQLVDSNTNGPEDDLNNSPEAPGVGSTSSTLDTNAATEATNAPRPESTSVTAAKPDADATSETTTEPGSDTTTTAPDLGTNTYTPDSGPNSTTPAESETQQTTTSAPQLETAENSGSTNEISTTGDITTSTNSSELENRNTIVSVEKNLQKIIEGISNVSVPGATIKSVRAASNGVELEQSFERPIVVGFRGINVPLPNSTADCGQSAIVKNEGRSTGRGSLQNSTIPRRETD